MPPMLRISKNQSPVGLPHRRTKRLGKYDTNRDKQYRIYISGRNQNPKATKHNVFGFFVLFLPWKTRKKGKMLEYIDAEGIIWNLKHKT